MQVKSIADMQEAEATGDSDSSKEDDKEASEKEEESEDENDKKRMAALAKLENAGEDTIFGQASHQYVISYTIYAYLILWCYIVLLNFCLTCFWWSFGDVLVSNYTLITDFHFYLIR